MDSAKIAQQLVDANVRFESMFWVPGICAAPPRDFDEFVEEELADAKYVIGPLSFLKEPLKTGGYTGEDVLGEMALRQRNGFIAKAVTPVPRDIRKDGSHSFSWGHCRTAWLYCDTLEELTECAVAWAARVLADAKRKKRAA